MHNIIMFSLPRSLRAFDTDTFNDVLKMEICSLSLDELPLQQGLSQSSYANDNNLSATVLKVDCNDEFIFAKTGLFYTGTIAGCNCADDPTPVDELNEYCELMFRINRQTGGTTVSLVT